MNIKALTSLAKKAAKESGEEILRIYNSADLGVEYKKDDSPLTKADRAAHRVIMKHLEDTGYPVLSEEGRDIPYAERKDWEYFWMVDPLDGTKEFIKKNGEFTVNIALIHQEQPIMGVVYAPVLDWMYWGNTEEGAWKQEENQEPTPLRQPRNKEVKAIVASRSHLSAETKEFMDQYPEAEVISMGSSLKFLLVAEDRAQLYPRFAPTMEWDTAAAHGVLASMGGEVQRWPEKAPLLYNKEDLLNPWFIVKN